MYGCRGSIREVRPIQDLKALFGLMSLSVSEKPQIVHTHSSKAGILGRWPRKAGRRAIYISYGSWLRL